VFSKLLHGVSGDKDEVKKQVHFFRAEERGARFELIVGYKGLTINFNDVCGDRGSRGTLRINQEDSIKIAKTVAQCCGGKDEEK